MNTPQPFEEADSENAHKFTTREPLPQQESAAPNAFDTLEESDAVYRYLFETNPSPLWIYDFETFSISARQ